MDMQRAFIGKTIKRYELSDDNESITFYFKDGSLVKLNAVGDCCSQSWIESIDAPKNLIGKVTAIEDIDMPNLGNNGTEKYPDVDYVSYYGLRITTNKGICVIDYRNNSNGYYGGSLEIV